MPNHVNNIIKISGRRECVDRVKNRILVTEDYIKEIIKRNEGLNEDFQIRTPVIGKLSFNRLIPKPTNIYCGNLNNFAIMQYGKENCWLKWNRSHWGTKWDAYGQQIYTSPTGELVMCFVTAWDPPVYYLEKLAQVCVEENCDMTGGFDDSYETGACFIDMDKKLRLSWQFDEEWADELENRVASPEYTEKLVQYINEKEYKKTGDPSILERTITFSLGRDM